MPLRDPRLPGEYLLVENDGIVEAIPGQFALRGPRRDLVRVAGTDDPRYVLVDHGDGVPALTLRADVELLPEGIDAREAVRMHLEAVGIVGV